MSRGAREILLSHRFVFLALFRKKPQGIIADANFMGVARSRERSAEEALRSDPSRNGDDRGEGRRAEDGESAAVPEAEADPRRRLHG